MSLDSDFDIYSTSLSLVPRIYILLSICEQSLMKPVWILTNFLLLFTFLSFNTFSSMLLTLDLPVLIRSTYFPFCEPMIFPHTLWDSSQPSSFLSFQLLIRIWYVPTSHNVKEITWPKTLIFASLWTIIGIHQNTWDTIFLVNRFWAPTISQIFHIGSSYTLEWVRFNSYFKMSL